MRRHNEMQRVLKDYTKKIPDHAIRVEAFAGTTAGTDLVAPKRVTADISDIVGAETPWIDVAVVDPGCQHYIQRYCSKKVPDGAAKAMETSKRNHHGTVKDPLPLPPASVMPFGRLRKTRTCCPWIPPANQRHTHIL